MGVLQPTPGRRRPGQLWSVCPRAVRDTPPPTPSAQGPPEGCLHPIVSKQMWWSGATGISSSLGTPGVSQPREGTGISTDATVKSKPPALQVGPGLILGTRKQRAWDKGAMGLISAAPGASPVLVGGAGASAPLQAPPQASHHFCPALWVVMGCGGRREGAPDLAQAVCLASPWRRGRRCQGWQAHWQQHSQGVINNLLSQGGLLGFRITRHRRRVAQMDPPRSYFLH